jgi:hypothetical protein
MADGPHIAVEHHDRYGVTAQVAHESPAADRALREAGFRPLAGPGQYVLAAADRDLTRRAQQAVHSLREANFQVDAAPAYDPRPAATVAGVRGGRGTAGGLQLEPDVAFGTDPDLGIVAAVADDRPFLDEVLRSHGFAYSDRQDLYLLPTGTPHNTAVRAVSGASQVLQDARLAVLADPRIMVPPAVPTPDGLPAREPVPAQSVTALTGELYQVRRATDVADILDQVVDERLGSVADLEEFADTAAAWSERLGTANGQELAGRLRATAQHVGDLRDELTELQLDFAVTLDTTPGAAPPLTALPHSRQRDVRPPAHEARAQAALLSSPHRPTVSTPPAETQRAAPAATAPRRTR